LKNEVFRRDRRRTAITLVFHGPKPPARSPSTFGQVFRRPRAEFFDDVGSPRVSCGVEALGRLVRGRLGSCSAGRIGRGWAKMSGPRPSRG